jgi:lipopolysaccharide heptosyltransferase II
MCGFMMGEFAPPSKTWYFQHHMEAPQKILVIRMSSIGDIILATPLLRVLHAVHPSSSIDFIVRKEYGELLRYNEHLHHLYEFDANDGFSGLRKLKKQLHEVQYHLVIDIHNSLRSRYIRWMLGAGDVVVVNKRIIARALLVRLKRNIYRTIVSVADRYIEPVRNYGIKNDQLGLELTIPDDVRTQAAAKMTKAGFPVSGLLIGFCPSAKHSTKCWLQERFAELGSQLVKDSHARILLFGGSEDKEKCRWIAKAINDIHGQGCAVDLSGELSLLESAVAMESCRFIVTNDSGLMHVSCAMKKKVVAIFGSTVREFGFFPVGTESVIVEKTGLYCRPCSHIGRTTCPEGHFRCMNEIRVEEVMSAVRTISPQP